MNSEINFELLFRALAESPSLHARHSATYQINQAAAAELLDRCGLREASPKPFVFGPFGELVFPYHAMGARDTLDLFGLDELIIFAFYWANRGRYRRVLDIGANVGLHSIVMARCSFAVTAFEPDPRHFAWLTENLKLNQCGSVQTIQAAVSDQVGQREFVRVTGNTTGSHLAGAKESYGELERFPVQVENFASLVTGVDLVKIDAEGHEPEILFATPAETWQKCDAMLEVGSAKNAERIYKHFQKAGVHMYAQKIGWSCVLEPAHIPTSHREGSLLISSRGQPLFGI
jgi:FkbM family methyltransferase